MEIKVTLAGFETGGKSPAMREMSLEHLCELLKYAVKRMICCPGSEPFIHPVDLKIFPDYRNYVVQPMDLTALANNIRNNLYGSTVAFMADAKWVLHNSIIYNSYQSKLTSAAKSITKICKQEMSEIETCSECYQNANTKKNSWFVEVCPKPHILLWAKLKGFPYWPAKAMTTNSSGLVDVRFFGAHDRAWLPVKECFLYSKKDPNTTNKNKRNNIAECIKEVDIHIEKLKEAYGEFCHAPYRTPYNPNAESEQLRFMLPRYKVLLKMKSPTSTSILKKVKQNDDKIKVYKSSSRDSLESRDDSLFQKTSDSTESINDQCDSRVRSDTISEDTDILSSSSKTSLNMLFNNDDKLDKDIKFSTQDFDKFMEGYGTEDDETTALTLNDEIRKKMIQYESDSEDDRTSTIKNDTPLCKDVERKEDNSSSGSSPEKGTEITLKAKGSMLTPISGKMRIIRNKRPIDISRNRVESESPHKMQRRNSDISTTSDSSRISGLSDKISRVEEFSDTLEVSLANTSKDSAVISFSENISMEKKKNIPITTITTSTTTTTTTNTTNTTNITNTINTINSIEPTDLDKLKPVIQICTGDLFNKNNDLKISPQSKSVKIADKLMKKIVGSEATNEIDKVEAVKKQILENLETNSTSQVSNDTDTDSPINDLVSSSNTNIDKVKDKEEEEKEKEEEQQQQEAISTNPNVSSSTESLITHSDVVKNYLLNDDNKTTEVAIDKMKELESKIATQIDRKNSNDDGDDDGVGAVAVGLGAVAGAGAKDGDEEEDEDDDDDDDDDDNDDDDDEGDSESEHSVIAEKNLDNSHVKLVNVSDILSGKINGNASTESMISNKEIIKISDLIEVKNEPVSDEERQEINSKSVSSDDDTLEKQATNDNKETRLFKVVDNLTRVIDSVATDYNGPLSVNKKELSLRPISKLIHSPKQKARKSFPNSPHSINHISFVTSTMKKAIAEKKPLQTISNMKVLSTLQNIQPHIVTSNVPTNTNNSNTNTNNQESLLYISPQQAPVINNMALLPPNQPITLTTQNVGSPILAMVQHHGISTPSLIIQQSSSMSTPVSQCSIVTPVAITSSSVISSGQSTNTLSTPITTNTNVLSLSQISNHNLNSDSNLTDDRSGISEQISKAVGDLFCRPPPVLKPRPPGPLTTFFDGGLPSSAGPTAKLINSISHRLSDYFRGLLCESFQDLSTIGSPEAKIRSLELEIETIKYKHNEEMVELRKNINSVLKDIQKSIIEDKAKIVDETRSACEAERLRCIEETKSKQWCAFCLKEAQFYCCWNTSYCDYPCQQKHWPAHMNTCSQARNAQPSDKSQIHAASKLTKAVNSNKTMIKPARMIVKQTSKGVPMYVPLQRSLQAGQQTLTLVESTPGNFEIVGNHGPISLGGKIVPTTTIKVKPGNVITVAPSSSNNTALSTAGTSKTIILSQKAPQILHKSSTENKT